MHFQVKIPGNGRKNVFANKQNKKQGTADVFRSQTIFRNVKTAFSDSVKTEGK